MTPLQRKFHRLIRATGVFDDTFYARAYPDVRVADALEHYIVQGEREGRQPSLFFEPHWYLQQRPKLKGEDNLLAHYLTVGDRDGMQPMPGFDPVHVRQSLGGSREPALAGFLRARGAGRWINPNRFFDYAFYLGKYPDVAARAVDAFWHFVHVGADEGRLPSADFSWFLLRERYQLTGSNSEAFRALMLRWRHLEQTAAAGSEAPSVVMLQDELRAVHRPAPAYEGHDPPPTAGAGTRGADVYAFYLTQFHRVAENDAWWGEGFTEWHNVVRAVPRFSGHYQPRIPSSLGFYDLDDPRVMPRQVALARQAGLAGFAFYYYHFGHRRLLEKPLDRFVEDASLDMGFFLIWANETWTRRWDGSESEVLIEQTYPPDMPERLAADLARYFADPRYRRIDGRPLLPIYRVGDIPEAEAWLNTLREAFRAIGEDPLLYLCQTFEDRDPTVYGLDGAMEFPPHKHSGALHLRTPAKLFGADPALKVWDYDEFVQVSLADPEPGYPLIRTGLPSWDNDSRRQGASSILHGSSPAKFRHWLDALVGRAEKAADAPNIVCVNAWNEWGEGAYLEPDRHFGYAYLNAVQAVLRPEPPEAVRRIVLIGHDAFAAGAQRILLNIGRTLKAELGIAVAFVLLRADAGYNALLDEFRGVGETFVAGENLAPLLARLADRGFRHAILNSAASAPALESAIGARMSVLHLVHELPEMFATLGAAEPMRRAAPSVRGFVAPTQAIAAMLAQAGLPRGRILLLPQGLYQAPERIDPAAARERLLGPGEERAVIVGLGYGDRRKGLDLFVAACEAAVDAGRDWLFVWQGDWDPATAAEVELRAAPLIAAGLLRHRAQSGEIGVLLGAADAFFLSSREDPLPSAAIEAWSTGLPVAAIARAGGISDMIALNPTLGALAGDESPAALLQAIDAALALGPDGERAEWARQAFDWTAYVRGLVAALYEPATLDVAIIGHNHSRFAHKRVQSLVRQTLAPRQIVYHDVASTDGKGELVRAAVAEMGIGFVVEAANDGRLYRTWAAIARGSDATYLHLAEGDDWIAPAMLERCVEALGRHPEAAYAFVGVEWIDEEDRVIADHGGYPAHVLGSGIAGGGVIGPELVLASDMLVKNPVLTISSVLWRREALLALIEENEADLAQLDFAFDWLLYLRAAHAGHSAVFVAETLCRHRHHAASFATRDNLGRHAQETARLYALEPAPQRGAERARYLDTLA